MASGSGWNIWVWLAGGGCGWNLWVWLYIDFLIIITYPYIIFLYLLFFAASLLFVNF